MKNIISLGRALLYLSVLTIALQSCRNTSFDPFGADDTTPPRSTTKTIQDIYGITWQLSAINYGNGKGNVAIPEGLVATLQFTKNGARANSFCNQMSATVTTSDPNTIKFSNMLATERWCTDMKWEADYFKGLTESFVYSATEKKLVLYYAVNTDTKSTGMLVFTLQENKTNDDALRAMIGTEWRLVSDEQVVNSEITPAPQGQDLRLWIKEENGKFSLNGIADCAPFRAQITAYTDPNPNDPMNLIVEVSGMEGSLALCSPGSWGPVLTKALTEAIAMKVSRQTLDIRYTPDPDIPTFAVKDRILHFVATGATPPMGTEKDLLGSWKLVSYEWYGDDTAKPVTEDFVLSLSSQGKVSGVAACNAIAGEYFPALGNRMSVTASTVTDAFCGQDSFDNRYMAMLNATTHYSLPSMGLLATVLELYSPQGKLVYQKQ